MPELRRYAPSIVLIVWGALWALGLRGDAVIVAWLLITAAACAAHVVEETRRHRL